MSADNVQDTAIWILMGFAGLGVIWFLLFVSHVIFVTPFRIWRDAISLNPKTQQSQPIGPTAQRQTGSSRAAPDDPLDVVLSKKRLVDFIADYLIPAAIGVDKTLHCAAAELQSRWSEHPLGIVAARGAMSQRPYLPGFSNLAKAESMRVISLEDAQKAVLHKVLEYQGATHRVQEIALGMEKESRLKTSGQFGNQVAAWYPLHEKMVSGFLSLREGAEFPIIKAAERNAYISDKHYDLKVLEPITGPQKPL